MKAEVQPVPTFPGPKETSTKYTKTCEQDPKTSNQGNFVDIVDESQGSKESKTLSSFTIGSTIQYRIPVRITSPTKYEWAWHRGTIELVDEDWQMILVLPETEEQPWRWIAAVYVQIHVISAAQSD
jgi:hypothetical protein